jgi:D-alanine-D-alanine ligase
MRVGLTYDLRSEYLAAGYNEEETAEFDSPVTIDAIEGALRELGHETDRVGNVRQLVERLAHGDRWDLVFNIAEGLRGAGREAQVPALLDAYEIAYTGSDPLVMALTLDKAWTKIVVRHAGVPTPEFVLVRQLEDLEGLTLRYPLFAKPVAEGTGKGISAASKIATPAALRQVCGELLAKFRQPVLVEEFLPGREFTVAIAGAGDRARVLATMEISLLAAAEPEVYSYSNKEQWEGRVDYRIARAEDDEQIRRAEAHALAAWRTLRCRDAGRIDLRCDAAGEPNFMEVNPLAGQQPHHSDLPMICRRVGIRYVDLIAMIVESAQKRSASSFSGR